MSRPASERSIFPFHWRDLIGTLLIFGGAVLLCLALNNSTTDSEKSGHVTLIFVLAVALVSRVTDGYLWGVLSSLASVFFVNYYFTYPFRAFNFTLAGYPLTFLTMLAVSLSICASTAQSKQQEALRAKAEQENLRANLLRAVSHDIRTPLTSIVGASSTLMELGGSLSDEEKQTLLHDINEDAHWLIRVVENLLSVTRISGQTKLSKEGELIEDVMAETVQKFRRNYGGIEVVVQPPQEVVLVPMDATLIAQVLFNLMENAARHGGTTKTITLTAETTRGYAVVNVRDDGQGIAPEKLQTLFSGTYGSFGSGAPDAKRNMGIGLSVCRSIIRAHGGELSARNHPAGGAEFTFTLPLNEEESHHEDQG